MLLIFSAHILFYLIDNSEVRIESAERKVPCENCGELFLGLTKHIGHNASCKDHYGARFDEMKRKQQSEKRQRYRKKIGKEEVKEKNKEYLQRHRKKIGKEKHNERNRNYYQEKRDDSDANLARFYQETEFGPEFVCVSCHGGLFEKEVYEFTEARQQSIEPEILGSSCSLDNIFHDPCGDSKAYVCKTCFKDMKNKGKMPSRSEKNGLKVEALELPPDLADISTLENTLIARERPFMKISLVPKSKLEKMIDRTVLVPVEPGDIMETLQCTLLPRSMAKSPVIPVDFKKMKDWKYIYQTGYIRPVKMVKALAHLKDSGNKYYQDVIIQCTFCDRKFEENDTDVLEHIEMCHLNAQDIGETEVEDNTVQDREEDESNTLPTIKKYQAQDDISCIEMKNPQVNIVINNTKKAKTVPIKDSVRNKNVVLAPGEGKIPSAIMRTIDFDVKAFPLKHPSGNYGLDYERTVRLYKQQYFRARLFHYSGVYANDNDYLFMCQQYIERASLEAQINISGQKGTIIKNLDGTKTMKLNDAFSVFQKVPGTPKYWQQKKYNLLAMVNVLGPFQWFFTFSCAELRWPQIIACILRKKGHKVEVLDPAASTENAEIKVDDELLTEYLKKTGLTLRDIVQKETFLVTRIFDQRVKSFIKNILMDQGEKGMKLKNYMYRVEFQARLAPHIHGCAWMKKDVIKE